jgi:hypothetical protein
MDRRVLYCYVCHRAHEMTQDEVAALTVATWPRCCGEPLLFYVQTPAPPGDTVPEMPAMRPSK